jgi:hypothetical protein
MAHFTQAAAPVARHSRGPCYRAARLSAPLYGLTGVASHPSPGQRFLETPGQRLNEPAEVRFGSITTKTNPPAGYAMSVMPLIAT